jgi:hypothetical protein
VNLVESCECAERECSNRRVSPLYTAHTSREDKGVKLKVKTMRSCA